MVSGFSGGQNPVPRGTATQPRILAPPQLPKPHYPYFYKLFYIFFILLLIFPRKKYKRCNCAKKDRFVALEHVLYFSLEKI